MPSPPDPPPPLASSVSRILARWKRWDPVVVAATLYLVLVTLSTTTPSSYGTVLEAFGLEGVGLVSGTPRPIRSDESRIWTPMVQATVDSDFGQVNQTSLYGESLRTFYAMPLRDWGALFKPQFWPFFFLAPAVAYSFYFAVHTWLFVVGYYLMFLRLRWSRSWSLSAALLLYFTPWVQLWWTSLGPLTALLPWMVLICLSDLRPLLRTLAVAYLTACWLLTGQFYPPFLAVACVAAGALVWDRRPDLRSDLGRWVSSALGVGAGAAIAAAYLWEPLSIAVHSADHGARAIRGGLVSPLQWISQFQPMALYHGYEPLVTDNACGLSTAGSLLWVLLLCFVDWRGLTSRLRTKAEPAAVSRATLIVLGLLTAWMLLPVPAIFGKPLLLHKIHPIRVLFASGLLWLGIALSWMPRLQFLWSWRRFALLTAIVVATWWPSSSLGSATAAPVESESTSFWTAELLERNHADLYILPIVLLIQVGLRFGPRRLAASLAGGGWLLASAALANLAGFSAFNPVQLAGPIFDRPESRQLAALRSIQESHPQGWLVLGGGEYYGSALNGYGFRSVNHTFIHPQPALFRQLYPELSAAEFHQAFERYGAVQLVRFRPPRWTHRLRRPLSPNNGATLVPYRAFLPELQVEVSSTPPTGSPSTGGKVKKVERRGHKLSILLSADFDGLDPASRLVVYVEGGAKLHETWLDPRRGRENWQWQRLLYSRVELTLRLPRAHTPMICVESIDSELGRLRLDSTNAEAESWCGGSVEASRPSAGAVHAIGAID